jgi:membrane-bound ClpP family serine protease
MGRSDVFFHFSRQLIRPLLTALAALLVMASISTAQEAPGQSKPEPVAPMPADKPVVGSTSMPVGIAASRQATNVVVITVHGEIDDRGVLVKSVERRIAQAAAAGADAIVFDIDSPGGELNSVLRICDLIKQSPVANTIAWINKEAFSGGAIIALACREMIVNDPASFGDAMPITYDRNGNIKAIDPETLRKLLPPLVSEVVRSSRRYNTTFGGYLRDEYLVQAIVANDVELWWVKNKKSGQKMAIDRDEFEMLFPGALTGGQTRLPGRGNSPTAPPHGASTPTLSQGAQFPANSTKLAAVAKEVEGDQQVKTERPRLGPEQRGEWDLIDKITDGTLPAVFKGDDMLHYGLAANDTQVVNGSTVLKPITSDADLMAFLGAKNLQRYDMNWSEYMVGFLSNYIVKGVLIVIFLIALFIEMTHPGAILPGSIALVALIVLLAPPFLIGMAGWWQVLAIISGVVLLGLEAFVIPGFGVTGVLGLLLLFGGLVGTFVPQGGGAFPTSTQASSDMLWGATTVILSGATAIFGMWLIARHFGSLPVLGKLVLKDPNLDEDSEGWLAAMDPDVGVEVRPGDVGIALTPLRPAGRVEVGDKVVDAISEFGFIPIGAKVRIVSVTTMRIGVEPVKSGTEA